MNLKRTPNIFLTIFIYAVLSILVLFISYMLLLRNKNFRRYLQERTWNERIKEFSENKKKQNAAPLYNQYGRLDTIFPNGDYVKYVKKDSGMDIAVRLNNKETALGWSLPFTGIPDVLIPKFYYRANNLLLLERGQSSFRELIVCELINGAFKITRYETQVDIQCRSDFFVYKLSNQKDRIYMIGIFDSDKPHDNLYKNPEIRSKLLPAEYQEDTLKETDLKEDSIVLSFNDGKKLKLPIR